MAKLRGSNTAGGGLGFSVANTKQTMSSSSSSGRASSTKKRRRRRSPKNKVYENAGYLLRKSNRRTKSSFGTDGWDRRFASIEDGALILFESDQDFALVDADDVSLLEWRMAAE